MAHQIHSGIYKLMYVTLYQSSFAKVYNKIRSFLTLTTYLPPFVMETNPITINNEQLKEQFIENNDLHYE